MRLTVLLPLVALLAACGDDPAPTDDSRAATGEVLEGSVSDAMLPLATVRSQPPLLDPEQVRALEAAERGEDAGGDAAETPAPAPAAEPPAAEPTSAAEETELEG